MKKLLGLLRGTAALDAPALLLRGNAKKDGIGIIRRQLRVQAIGALHHLKGGVGNGRRRGKRHGAAVKPAEGDILAPGQGQKHLLQKALPVHVAPGLGKALRRALVGLKKKIVGMENRAAVLFLQPTGQGGLSGGGAAVDGQGQGLTGGQVPPDSLQ